MILVLLVFDCLILTGSYRYLADFVFLTVRFSFLYFFIADWLLYFKKKIKRAVLLCLYGMFSRIVSRFWRCNCVACRKRVQRYNNFLNYKTFLKEIFKEIYRGFIKRLIRSYLTEKKILKIYRTKITHLLKTYLQR